MQFDIITHSPTSFSVNWKKYPQNTVIVEFKNDIILVNNTRYKKILLFSEIILGIVNELMNGLPFQYWKQKNIRLKFVRVLSKCVSLQLKNILTQCDTETLDLHKLAFSWFGPKYSELLVEEFRRVKKEYPNPTCNAAIFAHLRGWKDKKWWKYYGIKCRNVYETIKQTNFKPSYKYEYDKLSKIRLPYPVSMIKLKLICTYPTLKQAILNSSDYNLRKSCKLLGIKSKTRDIMYSDKIAPIPMISQECKKTTFLGIAKSLLENRPKYKIKFSKFQHTLKQPHSNIIPIDNSVELASIYKTLPKSLPYSYSGEHYLVYYGANKYVVSKEYGIRSFPKNASVERWMKDRF